MIEVETYEALVRVIGFLRYHLADRTLLYRGQPRCHGSMRPTAYRGQSHQTVDSAVDQVLDVIRAARPGFEDRATHKATTEPAMQHYGLKTRWLDLVDSLPHALFFALHRQAHIPQGHSGNLFSLDRSQEGHGVVYVLDAGKAEDMAIEEVEETGTLKKVQGLWRFSDGGRLCDLRRAKPSQALRPHMQHGWLFRGKDGEEDYWSRVVARIFFPGPFAHHWLGGGLALSVEGMVPGPEADGYYRGLLGSEVTAAITEEGRRTGLDLGAVQRFVHHIA